MSKRKPWKYQTVGSFDPMKGKRLSVGWLAMVEVLEDGGWHFRDELVEWGMAGSDLRKQTLQNMLSRLSAPDGPLERRGSVKNRRYRLTVE